MEAAWLDSAFPPSPFSACAHGLQTHSPHDCQGPLSHGSGADPPSRSTSHGLLGFLLAQKQGPPSHPIGPASGRPCSGSSGCSVRPSATTATLLSPLRRLLSALSEPGHLHPPWPEPPLGTLPDPLLRPLSPPQAIPYQAASGTGKTCHFSKSSEPAVTSLSLRHFASS